MTKGGREPLHVLTVCGVGMGSSLMLRLTAEEVLRELGVAARVEATDLSSAKGMRPDVILGQGMHTAEFEDAAPVVVTVANFMDKDALRCELQKRLHDVGWLE